jgi:hypothetical protein
MKEYFGGGVTISARDLKAVMIITRTGMTIMKVTIKVRITRTDFPNLARG